MQDKNWKIFAKTPGHYAKILSALNNLGFARVTGSYGSSPAPDERRYLYTGMHGITVGSDHAVFRTTRRTEMFLQADGTFADQENKPQVEPMKHKHSEIFMALANMQPIECQHFESDAWFGVDDEFVLCHLHNPIYSFRVKVATVMIGEYEINAAMTTAPALGILYYVPHLGQVTYTNTWHNGTDDNKYLNNGLVHSTPQAAAAHAEALVSLTKRC